MAADLALLRSTATAGNKAVGKEAVLVSMDDGALRHPRQNDQPEGCRRRHSDEGMSCCISAGRQVNGAMDVHRFPFFYPSSAGMEKLLRRISRSTRSGKTQARPLTEAG